MAHRDLRGQRLRIPCALPAGEIAAFEPHDEVQPVLREVPEQLDVVPAPVVDVDAVSPVNASDSVDDAYDLVVLAAAVRGDRRPEAEMKGMMRLFPLWHAIAMHPCSR